MSNPVLSVKGVSKHFGRLQALDEVSLEVEEGSVVALLGENGAGKTTLMRIVAGLEFRDAGSIEISGEEHRIATPGEALGLGIAMVHQHFSLVGNMSVAENVLLGRNAASLRRLSKRQIAEEVETLCTRYSIQLDPGARVDTLSVDYQAKVEIVKALARGARLLILDEPTSSLGPTQIEDLFATVKSMVVGGLSVILVSHRLAEVSKMCNDVVVLRRGEVTEKGAASQFTEQELVRAMIGDGMDGIYERGVGGARISRKRTASQIFQVQGLRAIESGVEKLRGVSFGVRPGEIVGVIGVEGNGQGELLEVLAGLRQPSAGHILLSSEEVTGMPPLGLQRNGIVTISGDRLRWDIAEGLTAAEVLALHRIASGEYRRFGRFLTWRRIEADAAEQAERYDIRPRNMSQPIEAFSGGNQQKIVVARALSRDPKVLVLGQPTRGLDVAARSFVHKQIRAARENGVAIVLVSFDLDELITLSDRVIVLFKGRSAYEAERGSVDIGAIGDAMAGVNLIRENPGAEEAVTP